MNTYLIIALLVIMAGIILSRVLSNKALALLDENQRSKLLQALTEAQKKQLIPLLVLIALFVAAVLLFRQQSQFIISAYLVLFMLYMVLKQLMTFSVLNKLELPSDFLRRYKLAISLPTIAMIILAAAFFIAIWQMTTLTHTA